MDPVELAPLPNVQRTENRVVENPGALAKPSFALCQSCVHLLNLRKNGDFLPFGKYARFTTSSVLNRWRRLARVPSGVPFSRHLASPLLVLW